MARLLKLKSIIRQIAISDEFAAKKFKDGKCITSVCGKEDFWTDMGRLVLFLRPLKRAIKIFDSSAHTTEHAYPTLSQQEEIWKKNSADVRPRFKSQAINLLSSRTKWLLFDVHLVAYALSPRYHSHNIFGNQYIRCLSICLFR